MANRVFGCDDCLAVCPWNKYAEAARATEFLPRAELSAPRLATLAALDEAAFRTAFSHSPVKRLGHARFLRNLLIGLGNTGDPAHLPVVEARLDHPSPLVRAMAVWALAPPRLTNHLRPAPGGPRPSRAGHGRPRRMASRRRLSGPRADHDPLEADGRRKSRTQFDPCDTHLCCRAAWMLLLDGSPSWRQRGRPQPIDEAEDFPKQMTRLGNLPHLERDIPAVAHDLGALELILIKCNCKNWGQYIFYDRLRPGSGSPAFGASGHTREFPPLPSG